MRARPAAVAWAALALCAAGALAGCTGLGDGRAVDRGRPLEARAGIVFLIPGIWPDGGWLPLAERALRAAGLEAVPVPYDCFLPGFISGAGTDAPAERIAALARALEERHGSTGCPAPLRYHAIGYSGGTVVALKAAWRGVRLDTAHLGGSPIPAFSPALEDAVRAGRIGRALNYWSILDGVTGWGWGMGQFGYHGSPSEGEPTGEVVNVPLAYPHALPPFDEDLAGRIGRDLAAAARDSPPHRCFAEPAFRGWWLKQVRRMEAEEPIEEPAPALTASRRS